jgi:hypothetical protein
VILFSLVAAAYDILYLNNVIF